MTLFISETEAQTVALAGRLAKRVKKGDVITLYGTLGAGKTTFCRGFIQSLLPQTEVPSPTFTLLQTYETPDFPVFHFDMYRLKSPEEAYEIGIEDAFVDGVSLIEWPDKIQPILPKKQIRITIEIIDGKRQIEIEGIDL